MSRPPAGRFAADFARSFSGGDLARVLEHYAADAVLFDAHDVPHHGLAAIGQVLAAALRVATVMTATPRRVVERVDLALLENEFELRVGERVVLRSTSVEVLRWEADRWRLVIDRPYAGTTRTRPGPGPS